jgi:hypothetical protein
MGNRTDAYRVLVERSERERETNWKISVFERIILKWTCKKWDRVVDLFDPAHDGGSWGALVNAVMNLSFAYMHSFSSPSHDRSKASS